MPASGVSRNATFAQIRRVEELYKGAKPRRLRCAQRRIELRIALKFQFCDDLLRQIARGQKLNLVLHRGRIARQRGKHRRLIGDIVLALIEHDHGRTRIQGRQKHQHEQAQRHDRKRDIADQPQRSRTTRRKSANPNGASPDAGESGVEAKCGAGFCKAMDR